jgi:hypothetical protein
MLTERDGHVRNVGYTQLTVSVLPPLARVSNSTVLKAVIHCCSYACMQMREPLADSDLDCCDVHTAAAQGHLGGRRLLLSRSEQSGLSFNDQHFTPLLLVQHSSSSVCSTAAALCAVS